MPEGDTLWNIALRLGPALEGRELTAVSVPRLRGMERLRVGDVVQTVQSRGKYLEVEMARGVVLRTHLRMTGSWELYERGVRWRKPRHLARAVLEVPTATAVCFQAPVVEIGRVGDGRLDHLGPDLCRADADIDEVLARIRSWVDPGAEVGDVLLDQRIAAGIGNVYKCEALFACGVNPAARIGELDESTRSRLYQTAAGQLRANLGRERRVTFEGGLAVYGRDRQACRVCGSPIRCGERGGQARSTWWCPRCQPEVVGGRGAD